MTSPKKPINVGDKVWWVAGIRELSGEVESKYSNPNGAIVIVKYGPDPTEYTYVHCRQIFRVRRKVKKPKTARPKEFWVNFHDFGFRLFINKEEADKHGQDRIACVRYVKAKRQS